MKEPHGGCEQTACQTTFDVIGPPSGAWPTGPNLGERELRGLATDQLRRHDRERRDARTGIGALLDHVDRRVESDAARADVRLERGVGRLGAGDIDAGTHHLARQDVERRRQPGAGISLIVGPGEAALVTRAREDAADDELQRFRSPEGGRAVRNRRRAGTVVADRAEMMTALQGQADPDVTGVGDRPVDDRDACTGTRIGDSAVRSAATRTGGDQRSRGRARSDGLTSEFHRARSSLRSRWPTKARRPNGFRPMRGCSRKVKRARRSRNVSNARPQRVPEETPLDSRRDAACRRPPRAPSECRTRPVGRARRRGWGRARGPRDRVERPPSGDRPGVAQPLPRKARQSSVRRHEISVTRSRPRARRASVREPTARTSPRPRGSTGPQQRAPRPCGLAAPRRRSPAACS